jgi:hypothetical protein
LGLAALAELQKSERALPGGRMRPGPPVTNRKLSLSSQDLGTLHQVLIVGLGKLLLAQLRSLYKVTAGWAPQVFFFFFLGTPSLSTGL